MQRVEKDRDFVVSERRADDAHFCHVRFLWRLDFKRFLRLCLFILRRRFFFRLPMVRELKGKEVPIPAHGVKLQFLRRLFQPCRFRSIMRKMLLINTMETYDPSFNALESVRRRPVFSRASGCEVTAERYFRTIVASSASPTRSRIAVKTRVADTCPGARPVSRAAAFR